MKYIWHRVMVCTQYFRDEVWEKFTYTKITIMSMSQACKIFKIQSSLVSSLIIILWTFLVTGQCNLQCFPIMSLYVYDKQ